MSQLPLFGPQVKYGSTNAQRQQLMAQQLLQQGVNTRPAEGGIAEVLARIGTAGIGGYLSNRADETEKAYQADRMATLAKALSAGQGAENLPGPNPDGSAGYNLPGDPNAMAAILMGNPATANMGAEMGMKSIMDAQAQAAALRKMQQEYELKAKYDPQIAGATEMAKNPALLGRKEGEAAIDLKYKPQIAGATAAAENPALIDRAAGEAQARLPAQQALAQTNAGLDVAKAGPIAEAQANAQAPGKAFDRSNTLRDEYNNLTKDFRTVQDAYSKINSTSDTGAGDMSLLYSYVKLLDPGSVVRESEFATAAASGSFGQQVQGAVQRVLTGERLPADLRKAFKEEAGRIYQGQKKGYDTLSQNYTELAKRYNLKPEDVIQNYAQPMTAPADNDPLGLRK